MIGFEEEVKPGQKFRGEAADPRVQHPQMSEWSQSCPQRPGDAQQMPDQPQVVLQRQTV